MCFRISYSGSEAKLSEARTLPLTRRAVL